jgi:hypothetical protein
MNDNNNPQFTKALAAARGGAARAAELEKQKAIIIKYLS